MNRQNLPVIVSAMLVIVLMAAYFLKDDLNNLISQQMQATAGSELLLSNKALKDSLFNYSENGKSYSYTLLEFGSKGCTVCKQMETVLEEIRTCCSENVNVVFVNTMHPENSQLVTLFAISAIPIQVVLDKNGKEVFRNYGFISAEDLRKRMNH